MRIYKLLVLSGLLLTASSAHAQVLSKSKLPASYRPEFGTMWTFDAPPLEYWKTRYNFTPDQAWLDNVRLASIRLPNCSASFVSQNGLVMTNHHCARACISAVSPADTNYQRTGYAARTMDEEKKCPASTYVDQLIGIEDVSARIQSKVTGTSSTKRVEQRDAEIAKIQGECAAGTTCQVVGFYQGGMYSLYKYRRFGDLRLVFAPEEEISFYGGDPDNFTYPRYDVDVTMLRVYENGQPYKPQNYLRWSANGAQEGDVVFVVGNPGSTGRLNTIAQMEYLRDIQYPGQLAGYKRQIEIYQVLSAQSEAAKRKYENTLFGLQNSYKAVSGYLSGLTNEKVMTRKREFEKDLRARIAKNAKWSAQFGTAWNAIQRAQDSLRSIAIKARYYPLATATATPTALFATGNLLGMATALARLPGQEALADSMRLPMFRGTAPARIKELAASADATLDAEFEQAYIAALLAGARTELGSKDPVLDAILAGRTPEQAAADIVKGTQLGNPDFRKTLIAGGAAAITSSNDPLVVLARKLNPYSLKVAQLATRQNNIISANAERVGQALFAAYGKSLPPDATFTLRISDGVVAGYPYNGTIAPYKTSFYGLFARSAEFDNKPPFHLPERWMNKKNAIDMSTPLDFVSTNDIIGGNSGSPVINRNSEVVGLIFDGNIEQLPNRFIFTDDVARSVSVHSRALTETIRKVFDAPRIADELEGKK
jgi:hypothetical protein